MIVELDEVKFGKRKYNKGAYCEDSGCLELWTATLYYMSLAVIYIIYFLYYCYLNSVLDCDAICKPAVPTEKSTQAGKSLVVSRANPNFCTFCQQRHASLSCTALDPVGDEIPSSSSSTNASLPPSKCKDCTMVDKTTITTVLDRVQQITTHKQIKLCIRHMVLDTSPPPPHSLDLSFTIQIYSHLFRFIKKIYNAVTVHDFNKIVMLSQYCRNIIPVMFCFKKSILS